MRSGVHDAALVLPVRPAIHILATTIHAFRYTARAMTPRSMLLEWVRRLGHEFARRGMPEVEVLRLYYLAVEQDLLGRLQELNIVWSEEHTLEWMRTLRVPPFESAYAIRPFGAHCAKCGAIRGLAKGVLAEVVFPGGARKRCQSCNDVWIEADRTA